jgi:hypothetical protein
MQGVLTDTHFTQRGRLGRLITFVSRMQVYLECRLRAGPGSEVDVLKRVVSKAATEMTVSVITSDLSTRP